LDLAGEWQHVRRKPGACQDADIKAARRGMGIVPVDKARAEIENIRLSCRSPRQHDFAKRPILDRQ